MLASDGLWDAMHNEEATALALKYRAKGAEAASRALVRESYARGSQDNITGARGEGAGAGGARGRGRAGRGHAADATAEPPLPTAVRVRATMPCCLAHLPGVSLALFPSLPQRSCCFFASPVDVTHDVAHFPTRFAAARAPRRQRWLRWLALAAVVAVFEAPPASLQRHRDCLWLGAALGMLLLGGRAP